MEQEPEAIAVQDKYENLGPLDIRVSIDFRVTPEPFQVKKWVGLVELARRGIFSDVEEDDAASVNIPAILNRFVRRTAPDVDTEFLVSELVGDVLLAFLGDCAKEIVSQNIGLRLQGAERIRVERDREFTPPEDSVLTLVKGE